MQIEELGRKIRFRDPPPDLRRRVLNDAGRKLWPPFFFAVALAAMPFACGQSQDRTLDSMYTRHHEKTPVPLSPGILRLAEK